MISPFCEDFIFTKLAKFREKKTLAKIHEFTVVVFISATTTIGYWTSGNDLAVEGTWTWGFPEGDLFSYTNWYPGEPNNHDHHEVT